MTHDEDTNCFEARRNRLRRFREPEVSPFNFKTEDFSSLQLLVLDALRERYHELAPAETDHSVRSLYVYHGCSESVLDNICNTGLVNLAGAGDRGYFGAGFYTTLNIELAAKYAAGDLVPVGRLVPVVMCAAWVGTAYPITPGRDYGNNPDRDYARNPHHLPHSDFYGEHFARGFDCHVACVGSTASEAVDRSGCQYVEVAFNQENQVLPLAVLWLERRA